MKMTSLLVPALALTLPAAAHAQVNVTGGETNFAANVAQTLAQDAGLFLNQEESQGTLFPKSGFAIAFEITDGTDFAYNPAATFGDFAPVAGSTTLEHAAIEQSPGLEIKPAIAFNRADTGALFSVGQFNIGFDDARSGSGFFLEDITGDFDRVLFDLAEPDPADFTATSDQLFIETDLLFSPEFADFLQTEGLASTDLTGDSVGTVQVDIPEPASAMVFGAAALGLGLRRRQRG